MRIQSFLLLVVLLALGNRLPSASGRKKGDEKTTCPRPKADSVGIKGCNQKDSSCQLILCERRVRCAAHRAWACSGPLCMTEKSGGCPPDDGPCVLSVPDQCMNDRQCPSTFKCCYRACFRQCVPRVSVKRGSCPEDRLRCLSPTKHTCNQDLDCSGLKRCCPSACGRDCRDPTRG